MNIHFYLISNFAMPSKGQFKQQHQDAGKVLVIDSSDAQRGTG